MTRPLQVRATRIAQRHIQEASNWWREHDVGDVFKDALERAITRLMDQPFIGVPVKEVDDVRRLLVKRIDHHVYYRVASRKNFLLLLALWHTRRGSAPTLQA